MSEANPYPDIIFIPPNPLIESMKLIFYVSLMKNTFNDIQIIHI